MQDEEEYKPQSPDSPEYEFKGDEFTGEYTVDEPTGGGVGRMKSMVANLMDRRRLLIIGGSLLAIILIYTAMTLFTSESKPPEAQVKPTPVAVRPEPVVETDHLANMATQINAQFKQYNEAITQNKTNIDALAEQVNAVSQSIIQMRSTLASMNNTVTGLGVTLKKLTAKPKPKKPTKLVLYYIKAIVPGRAWLVSSLGMPTTVRQGDRLPGYGRVMLIDPHQGVVATSSGRVIQYGLDDS